MDSGFSFQRQNRIFGRNGKYIPDFTYEVVSLNKYTNEELSKNRDEMSLVMLINKIQTEKDLENFRNMPEDLVNSIYGNAPKEIKDIFVKIIWSLLMKLNVPNEDEYYGAAEPPVRCGESHLSGLTEPPHFVY